MYNMEGQCLTMKQGAQYTVGDSVWIRKCGDRCTSVSQTGVITIVSSLQVVEVDVGYSIASLDQSSQPVLYENTLEPPLYVDVLAQHPQLHQQASSTELQPTTAEPRAALRRSTRIRHQRV